MHTDAYMYEESLEKIRLKAYQYRLSTKLRNCTLGRDTFMLLVRLLDVGVAEKNKLKI